MRDAIASLIVLRTVLQARVDENDERRGQVHRAMLKLLKGFISLHQFSASHIIGYLPSTTRPLDFHPQTEPLIIP